MSASADESVLPRAPGRGGSLAWLALSTAVVIVDQISKWYVEQHLTLGVPLHVLPVFDLTLLHNTGAAFSFLAGATGWQRWLFTLLALGVSGLIVVWLARLPREQPWTGAALALVLGGAVGNVIDRMRLGHVIDFIHLHAGEWYWPAFNVADSAISVGAVILAVGVLFGDERRGK
jgi:signal peptidase II